MHRPFSAIVMGIAPLTGGHMKTSGKVLLCVAPLIIPALLCLADDGGKPPGAR
jgi:hypothetical protein